jgi:uncharacterized membrane protein YebE (DUF533 family)
MFDAKSLLEVLVKGAAAPTAPQAGGGLGDLLGKMLQGGGAQAPARGVGGGLEDILRKMMPGSAPAVGAPAGSQAGGGLADILGKVMQQGGQGAGGVADILGKILGQAAEGVREGAQSIDSATGIGKAARSAVGQATGQSPEELLSKLKELIAQHQLGAGAAAGGLGAVVLGTKAGRSLAGSALKIGALALIGGLAYKAVQNYQQGKPLLDGAASALAAAPAGSGFETDAVTNEAAILYIRGMIAAAAADGRIDAAEQQRILGGLQQAGLEQHAEAFIRQEIASPASVVDLAAAVTSEQEAVQLFTAARLCVDLDTQEEHDFLVALAQRLGLDGNLVAHIDAAARGVG